MRNGLISESITLRTRMRNAADVRLRVDLLRQLSRIERTFRAGGVVVVEPSVDGMLVANSVGLPGHDHSDVEAHLRALLVERLIENGGMFHPAVGIHFARLTRRGRLWLLRHSDECRSSPRARTDPPR